MNATVQAEAFAPDQLVALVRRAVENVVDLDAIAAHEAHEVDARRELADRIGGAQ